MTKPQRFTPEQFDAEADAAERGASREWWPDAPDGLVSGWARQAKMFRQAARDARTLEGIRAWLEDSMNWEADAAGYWRYVKHQEARAELDRLAARRVEG
jgi:hypothetical protein